MSPNQIQELGIDTLLSNQLQSWGIQSLTEIQKLAISKGVANGQSMIVCAPTSSGKTLIGEIAVLCGLQSGRKAIYLVSHKALADQKYEDFQKRFGEEAATPLGSIGLSTGDRDEGDIDPQLLVATYEKALGLFLSGQLDPKNSVVVADELQILADPTRGPNIEALCTVFRQRGCGQFIALTATVENPSDLAGWMNCDLASSGRRDIALHQEIWYQGNSYKVTFGQTEGQRVPANHTFQEIPDIVKHILQSGLGPVLVFTESRREAVSYANEYSSICTRSTDGIAIAEQLNLFSEPTESSEQLQKNVERNVAFHTADLTPQQRQVIEGGFINAKFNVCFATSTLAAGVNFPFKTVVFPKLTFQWGDRQGEQIKRSDYRNMSGRAGRLGMHEEGFSILLPKNGVELRHANNLVLPENDKIVSRLVDLSMRRTVLMLVASGLVNCRDTIRGFFENTLFWYQIQEDNPIKLDNIIEQADKAIDWLIRAQMVEQHDDALLSTPLGKATSLSGLLPSTAAGFVEILRNRKKDLEEEFDGFTSGIIYMVCSSDEFCGKKPSRFLVYPIERSYDSTVFLSEKKLFQPLDRANNRLNQCVHALTLYIEGRAERQISFSTKVSSGGVHRLAIDVSWVLDGLHRLACVPDIDCPQQVANSIAMLSRRIRWGAPAEILDVIRVAERNSVPGFGRQRAMALLAKGLKTFQDIINYGKDKLVSILKNEHRTTALLAAIDGSTGLEPDRFEKAHCRVAKELGLEQKAQDCYVKLGTDYDDAIENFLKEESSWNVMKLDDGKRQNVPDILISLGDLELLIECKTCTKTPSLINKEEAFAVLQKAADFDDKMRRVTLGKPAFDEHSKLKARASTNITLVEHPIFMEGVLRVHTGSITPIEFLQWLGTPGVTELDRLSGKATYAVN